MKELKGIDIFKFLMAFCVIAIHAPEYLFPEERIYPNMFNWIIRLAVPFFFIASGFLMQQRLNTLHKPEQKRNYLFQRAKHLITIWSLWTIIYFPLTLWGFSHSDMSLDTFILGFIVSGHGFYAQPLWFVYSMAIITCLYGLFYPIPRRDMVFLIIFLCFTITKYYLSDIPALKQMLTFALGGGLPMLIGFLLGRKTPSLFQHSLCIIYFLIILITSFCMFYLGLSLSEIIGGLGVFSMSLYLGKTISFDTFLLRKLSIWIFYIHMYVIMIMMVMIRSFNLEMSRYFTLFIVCIITCIISFFLVTLSKWEQFKFLRNLS